MLLHCVQLRLTWITGCKMTIESIDVMDRKIEWIDVDQELWCQTSQCILELWSLNSASRWKTHDKCICILLFQKPGKLPHLTQLTCNSWVFECLSLSLNFIVWRINLYVSCISYHIIFISFSPQRPPPHPLFWEGGLLKFKTYLGTFDTQKWPFNNVLGFDYLFKYFL